MVIKDAKDFPQMHDGESFTFNWKKQNWFVSCCDCGLVHKLEFTVNGDKLTVKVRRRNQLTKRVRKQKGLSAGKKAIASKANKA